jgi:chorismate mutase
MKPVAIRGAVTVENDTADEIKQASVEMVRKIVETNDINRDDIIMVFLTMTQDLTSFNASSAIRLGLEWGDVPFFTSQEPFIVGGLEKCIRVLIQVQSTKTKNDINHVYLGNAAHLRPDLKE